VADGKKKAHLALSLGALGVVFGDIGTSPIYTFVTALSSVQDPGPNDAIGVASLIIWSLLLIVTVKYVLVVMRADYHGEGGVFSLLAILKKRIRASRGLRLRAYVIMLLFGAALLYGDGTITPAISVLSAMEGLEAVDPDLKFMVIPMTVFILLALFAVQRFGTGKLGRFFGVFMLVWFLAIGGIGLGWTIGRPEVLMAFNPLFAVETIFRSGWGALFLVGGAVLAVTGVEALYADMGHFSRKAISTAWLTVALPALVLNYLGQAALVIEHPEEMSGGLPFFRMVPSGLGAILLVGLATVATIIASQALISGVFSLTAQARDMEMMPKMRVLHTSRDERGQVFVPVANFLLAATCILLVLTFRSSQNMAAAYGLAVVGSMLITTIAVSMVARLNWKWSWWKVGFFAGVYLIIEGGFLIACLTKLLDGGYFPVLVAASLVTIMLTWHRGRAIVDRNIRLHKPSEGELLKRLESHPRLPGQLILVSTKKSVVRGLARLDEMMRQGMCPREEIIALSLVSSLTSHVNIRQSIRLSTVAPKIWHVAARVGYMQEPNAPKIIKYASDHSQEAISDPTDNTLFVLPREFIVEYAGNQFSTWRRVLFGILNRNQSYAPYYFFIPHKRIMEFTWVIRA